MPGAPDESQEASIKKLYSITDLKKTNETKK